MAVSQKRRKAKGKSIDLRFNGPEPIDVTPDNYVQALNWYNYEYDAEQARKYIVAFMNANGYTKQQIAAVKRANKLDIPTTVGWIARIMTNGNTVAESTLKFFNTRLDAVIESGKEVIAEKKETAPRISPHERLIAKAKVIAGEADAEVIDQYGDMYEFLVANEVSKPAAEFLIEYYQPCLDEVNSNDPDIKNAFNDVRKERKFWKTVLADLERYVAGKAATKKVRKPRKKKGKDANQLVSGLKYQKAEPSLKLISANPATIIGAEQVWIYNTARQLLTQYVARGPKGLTVSRSSIKGFDAEKSKTKSARRDTEKVLTSVLKGGKVKLRKLLSEINAAESAASGRMNENSVIVRVIK